LEDLGVDEMIILKLIFCLECVKKRDHLEDLGVDGIIIIKLSLKAYGGRMWTGFIWLRTQEGGELF
jgi:hypothetical protein